MERVLVLNDGLSKTLFAVVTESNGSLYFHGVSDVGRQWAEWVESNGTVRKLDDVVSRADYGLTVDGPRPLTRANRATLSKYLPPRVGRDTQPAPNAANGKSAMAWRASIDYKALTFVREARVASMAYEIKRARAFFDPDLGPSGGYRCPIGTRYGGQITDRFGRNCGWGVARRLTNAIVDAGERVEGRLDKRRERRVGKRNARVARRLGVSGYTLPKKPKRRILNPDAMDRLADRIDGGAERSRRREDSSVERQVVRRRRSSPSADKPIDKKPPVKKPAKKAPAKKPAAKKVPAKKPAKKSAAKKPAAKKPTPAPKPSTTSSVTRRVGLMKSENDRIDATYQKEIDRHKANGISVEDKQKREETKRLKAKIARAFARNQKDERIKEMYQKRAEMYDRQADEIAKLTPKPPPETSTAARVEALRAELAEMQQGHEKLVAGSPIKRPAEWRQLAESRRNSAARMRQAARNEKNDRIKEEYVKRAKLLQEQADELEELADKAKRTRRSSPVKPESVKPESSTDSNSEEKSVKYLKQLREKFDEEHKEFMADSKNDENTAEKWRKKADEARFYAKSWNESAARLDSGPIKDEHKEMAAMFKKHADDYDKRADVLEPKNVSDVLVDELAEEDEIIRAEHDAFFKNEADNLSWQAVQSFADMNREKAEEALMESADQENPKLKEAYRKRAELHDAQAAQLEKLVEKKKPKSEVAPQMPGKAREVHPAFVGRKPQEKIDGLGNIADQKGNPVVIRNDDIESEADAIRFVRDGGSLGEVPNEYWLAAIEGNSSWDEIDTTKRFKQLPKNGGAVGETLIFVIRDSEGKGTMQGWVLKGTEISRVDHHKEVMAGAIAAKLGMGNGAGWDGVKRVDGEMKKFAIIPFAANDFEEGTIVKPEAGFANYDAYIFNDLADKGHPQRLNHFIYNFLMGTSDRHEGNGMTFVVNGKAVVFPIDQGWAFRDVYDNPMDYLNNFEMDWGMYRSIQDHLKGLGENDRIVQARDLVDVYDHVLNVGKAIAARGEEQWLEDLAFRELAIEDSRIEQQAEMFFQNFVNQVKAMEKSRESFLNELLTPEIMRRLVEDG